jgi:predicted Zn-dependent peptidase
MKELEVLLAQGKLKVHSHAVDEVGVHLFHVSPVVTLTKTVTEIAQMLENAKAKLKSARADLQNDPDNIDKKLVAAEAVRDVLQLRYAKTPTEINKQNLEKAESAVEKFLLEVNKQPSIIPQLRRTQAQKGLTLQSASEKGVVSHSHKKHKK